MPLSREETTTKLLLSCPFLRNDRPALEDLLSVAERGEPRDLELCIDAYRTSKDSSGPVDGWVIFKAILAECAELGGLVIPIGNAVSVVYGLGKM